MNEQSQHRRAEPVPQWCEAMDLLMQLEVACRNTLESHPETKCCSVTRKRCDEARDFLARHAPKPQPQHGVEQSSEVEQLKAKLADEELACSQVIDERDTAVGFCDLFSATILGEDINWSCHETKWQEALDMLSNGKTIEVSGIMLRRSGDYAIVEAEIDGKWREVIREFIDAPFSHIVEHAGIADAKESELNAVPRGVEESPQPAVRYACSKVAEVGDSANGDELIADKS